MTALDERPRVYRFCVKLWATTDAIEDVAAVPVFHDWIREKRFGFVYVDVADYAHVPDGPGVVLVTHDVSFSLDRSQGRLALLAQRRRPPEDRAENPLATLIHLAKTVAAELQRDSRLVGKLAFDQAAFRVEANDRLHLPNTEAGFQLLRTITNAALASSREAALTRVDADPRQRLAIDVSDA